MRKVMLSLSSARELALDFIKRAQDQYKHSFDQSSKQIDYKVGEWIFIRFPAEETGHNRKLPHPGHGPYRITTWRDPDVSAVKVYFPMRTNTSSSAEDMPMPTRTDPWLLLV